MDKISRQDIQATCDDIVREFAPLQVILFGSYAYGTPTEDSDVDLLVVMPIPKSETRRQTVEILQRIPRRFRMDLLVRSPEEIAYRVSYNDWFLREITEKGKVLYQSTDFFLKPIKKEKRAMNPLTLEWIQKAEGDYTVMRQNHQSSTPVYDAICFHAQQCIEKYLKAWLQEANIPFSKTHDLKDSLSLIAPTIPAWRAWHSDFSSFTTHAVDLHYPGEFATAEDAAHVVQICTTVRQAVRDQLN
ncbi:MAG: HEPN domain-containing protein [Candidatus Poribacteria bacterium]|nr:HEPN domain-containing protein [Candidatus Poribacteria bacterium]